MDPLFTPPDSLPAAQHPVLQQNPDTPISKIAKSILSQQITKPFALQGVAVSVDPNEVVLTASPQEIVWCWDCTEKGGSLEWRPTKSDEEIFTLNREQFPVDQPTMIELDNFFLDGKIDGRNFQTPEEQRFLQDLGFNVKYDEEGIIFTTPSIETFAQNYTDLRSKDPNLPPLRLVEVEQILDSDAFVKLNIDYDLIFSKSSELIHDSFFHIVRKLLSIKRAPQEYLAFKESQNLFFSRWRDLFLDAKENLPEVLEKICVILGAGSALAPQRGESMIKLLHFAYSAVLDDLSALVLNYNRIVKDPYHTLCIRITQLMEKDKDWLLKWSKEEKIELSKAQEMVQDFAKNSPRLGEVVVAIMELVGLTLSPRTQEEILKSPSRPDRGL